MYNNILYYVLCVLLICVLLVCVFSLFKTFKVDKMYPGRGLEDIRKDKGRVYKVLMNSDLTLGNTMAIYGNVGDADLLIRDIRLYSPFDVIMFGKTYTLEYKIGMGETIYLNIVNGTIDIMDRVVNRIVYIYFG